MTSIVLRGLAYGLSLIALIAAYARLTDALDFPGAAFVAALAISMLFFISTFIHEGGHALAARMVGGTVIQFCVMPWVYDVADRRLRRAGAPAEGDLGGYVRWSRPRDLKPHRQMWVAAAGPLAELALAALIIIGLALISAEPAAPMPEIVASGAPPGLAALPANVDMSAIVERERWTRWLNGIGGLAVALCEVLALLAVVSAVSNLLPFKGSDGTVIWRSWRRAAASARQA